METLPQFGIPDRFKRIDSPTSPEPVNEGRRDRIADKESEVGPSVEPAPEETSMDRHQDRERRSVQRQIRKQQKKKLQLTPGLPLDQEVRSRKGR